MTSRIVRKVLDVLSDESGLVLAEYALAAALIAAVCALAASQLGQHAHTTMTQNKNYFEGYH